MGWECTENHEKSDGCLTVVFGFRQSPSVPLNPSNDNGITKTWATGPGRLKAQTPTCLSEEVVLLGGEEILIRRLCKKVGWRRTGSKFWNQTYVLTKWWEHYLLQLFLHVSQRPVEIPIPIQANVKIKTLPRIGLRNERPAAVDSFPCWVGYEKAMSHKHHWLVVWLPSIFYFPMNIGNF